MRNWVHLSQISCLPGSPPPIPLKPMENFYHWRQPILWVPSQLKHSLQANNAAYSSKRLSQYYFFSSRGIPMVSFVTEIFSVKLPSHSGCTTTCTNMKGENSKQEIKPRDLHVVWDPIFIYICVHWVCTCTKLAKAWTTMVEIHFQIHLMLNEKFECLSSEAYCAFIIGLVGSCETKHFYTSSSVVLAIPLPWFSLVFHLHFCLKITNNISFV